MYKKIIHTINCPLEAFCSSQTILVPLILAILLLSSCNIGDNSQKQGDSWHTTMKQGQGTLQALYVPAEGFAYQDQEGRLTGVTVDILNDFADFVSIYYHVDINIEFIKEENWQIFYRRIAEGEDGLIGMGNVTITEARKQELAFSPTYMTNIASLITHRDAPLMVCPDDIKTLLSSRKALAFEGTLHETRLRELIEKSHTETPIEMAHSNDEIIEILSKGDQYIAYIDLYNFYRATERGKPLKRHPAGDLAGEQFGYIMPLETTWGEALEAYFNHGDGLLKTDRYREILRKHLGDELAAIIIDANIVR